jgi:plasmid stabilization system protein ParE
MRQIRISAEALQDLADGFLFYEAQQAGLGDYFTSCLRADIESLRLYAGIHRVVYRDYHRLLSKVFPYGVFYTVDGDAISVWAIIDLRRDPAWIKTHLAI